MKKAAGIGGNEVNATMKNITQEQLPDFLKEGEAIGEQLKKGIKNKENDAEEAVKDLAKNITGSFKKEMSEKEFSAAIEKAVGKMKQFIDSDGNSLYKKATEYFKKIEKASKDQHPALIAEGEELIKSVNVGVEKGTSKFLKKIQDLCSSALETFETDLSDETAMRELERVLKAMGKGVDKGGSELSKKIKDLMERIAKAPAEEQEAFYKEAQALMEECKKGINSKANGVEKAVKGVAKSITSSLKKELSKKEFRLAIEKAVEEMEKFLDSNGNELYQKVTAYLKKIENASKDQHPALIAEGKELIKLVGAGIDEAAPEVVDKGQKFCEKFIATLDKNLTAEAGIKKIEELLEGFGIGIEKKGNEIYQKLAGLAEKMAKTPQEQRETLREEAQALMEEFKKGVLAKKEELKESMDQTIDSAIKPVLKKFSPESARKIVQEWRDGLLNTVEMSAPKLKKQFEEVGQAVKDCYAGKISKEEAAKIIDEFMSATEETVKSKTSKVANAVKDVAEKATDELVKSFDKVEESKTKAMETNLALMRNSAYLFDELNKIVDVNGKIQSGYEGRAKFITDELRKAFGVEIKTVDGVIQGYDKLRGSVDEVIKRKEAQIILDSQETGYKEAIQNQSKAVEALNETEQKLKENREKRQKVEKERSEFLEKLSNSRNEVNKKHYKKRISRSTKVLKQLDSETNSLQKMYGQQKELVQKYAFNIGQYTDNLKKIYSGSYKEMTTATWDFVKQYGSASLATKKHQEKQKKEYESHLEILKELKKKSGSDMYDSQIANDEKILAKLNENLIKYNKIASSSFSKIGSESAKSFAEGIDSSGESAKESAKSMLDSTIEKIKNEEPEMEEAGKNLGYSVSKGLSDDDVLRSIQRSGRNAGQVAAQAVRDALNIHSPSKVGRNIGKNFGCSVGDGIDEGSKKAVEKAKKFGANLERTLREKLNKATNTLTIEKLENISKALTAVNRETIKCAKLPLVSAPNMQFAALNARRYILPKNETQQLDYDRLYSATYNAVCDGMAKVSVNLDGDAMGKFVTNTVVDAVYN